MDDKTVWLADPKPGGKGTCGVESMTRVQIGLGQNLSDWLRRVVQAR